MPPPGASSDLQKARWKEGREAVRRIPPEGAAFEVVLTDLPSPRGHGAAALARTRASRLLHLLAFSPSVNPISGRAARTRTPYRRPSRSTRREASGPG